MLISANLPMHDFAGYADAATRPQRLFPIDCTHVACWLWQLHVTASLRWSFSSPPLFYKNAANLQDVSDPILKEILVYSPESQTLCFSLHCIVAPLLEELLYRGFLLSSLACRWKWWQALCVSSFAFSLAHFSLEGSLQLFIIGCILGLVYSWSGNLAAPLAVHYHLTLQCRRSPASRCRSAWPLAGGPCTDAGARGGAQAALAPTPALRAARRCPRRGCSDSCVGRRPRASAGEWGHPQTPARRASAPGAARCGYSHANVRVHGVCSLGSELRRLSCEHLCVECVAGRLRGNAGARAARVLLRWISVRKSWLYAVDRLCLDAGGNALPAVGARGRAQAAYLRTYCA
ncbi:hypothetical protein AXF42_Ash007986 [Apostasia shenzhenica]|uniref:CAAX prenyl protease 2/Lysostaphin resistance protein A-like domain-containing protein n=1 Tax=Apostasia shenzhenica TaxID=1088818 RepID=A0A2I0A898_9ASPA|nr:hypothetical protein AXF42_Ash007986 [Apostasia shenzhenica]